MSIFERFTAMQCIGLIDHTSLNENDTEESVNLFLDEALKSSYTPACIMVYSKFIHLVKSRLNNTISINIGTVINFPHGSNSLENIKQEVNEAIKQGVNEVDMVINYKSILNNEEIGLNEASITIATIKSICNKSNPPILLKVILETGELLNPQLISLCTTRALMAGADFIKTSTGKVSINATLEAASVILKAIKDFTTEYPDKKGLVGFKAAGGMKSINDATQYIILAQEIMGLNFIHRNLRLGSSSLLKAANQSIKGN